VSFTQANLYEVGKIEYFRGVHFHQVLLENGKEIMDMIPELKKAGYIADMENIKDSLKLGQLILFSGMLVKLKRPSQMPVTRNSVDWKYPKLVMLDAPIFSYDGCYYIATERSSQLSQRLYLAGVAATLVAFNLMEHWPEWLQTLFWYGSITSLAAYTTIGPIRQLIFYLFWHIGLDLWVLPNFYAGFYAINPLKIIWPPISLSLRGDLFSPVTLLLRVLSASIVIY
jgi:hypothetical protein